MVQAADIIKSDNIIDVLQNHTKSFPSYSAAISVSNSSTTKLRSNSTSSIGSSVTTFANKTRLALWSDFRSTVINVSRSSSGLPEISQLTANRLLKSTSTSEPSISSNPSSRLESTLIISQSLIPSLSAAVSFIKETQTITTVEVTNIVTKVVTRIPSIEVIKSATAAVSIETAAFGILSTSSSIAEIFTSVGLPSSIGNALIPILLGNGYAAANTNDSASTVAESSQEQHEERQAITNFIQWLLSFLGAN